MQKTSRANKGGRPRTTGSGLQIQVRMHAPQVALLDAYVARNGVIKRGAPSRPEAIRRLIERALTPPPR
jgi:hypothetical protein